MRIADGSHAFCDGYTGRKATRRPNRAPKARRINFSPHLRLKSVTASFTVLGICIANRRLSLDVVHPVVVQYRGASVQKWTESWLLSPQDNSTLSQTSIDVLGPHESGAGFLYSHFLVVHDEPRRRDLATHNVPFQVATASLDTVVTGTASP